MAKEKEQKQDVVNSDRMTNYNVEQQEFFKVMRRAAGIHDHQPTLPPGLRIDKGGHISKEL